MRREEEPEREMMESDNLKMINPLCKVNKKKNLLLSVTLLYEGIPTCSICTVQSNTAADPKSSIERGTKLQSEINISGIANRHTSTAVKVQDVR
jgi:hypothetical protein